MTDKREVELPKLAFGAHRASVCDCDLAGGDPDCKIQPPYRSAYDQRCDQLLEALLNYQVLLDDAVEMRAKISQLEQQILEIQGNAAIRIAATDEGES